MKLAEGTWAVRTAKIIGWGALLMGAGITLIIGAGPLAQGPESIIDLGVGIGLIILTVTAFSGMGFWRGFGAYLAMKLVLLVAFVALVLILN